MSKLNHTDWEQSMDRSLDQAFELTPEGFHVRIHHHLDMLQNQSPQKQVPFSARKVALLAALILLIVGVAIAATRLGVQFFWTERLAAPKDAAMVEANTVPALSQQREESLLHGEVRDALWMQEEGSLSFAVHVKPNNPEAYALLCDGDIGVDGQNDHLIWWKGSILPFGEWVPKGKTALVMELPEATIGGHTIMRSWDWVSEDEGYTFLLEVSLPELERHADASIEVLAVDGLLPITITLSSRISTDGEIPKREEEAFVSVISASIPLLTEDPPQANSSSSPQQ